MPALALQFAMLAMSAALRGIGVVKPTMVVQALTVTINIMLAPVLIAGWGTGHALGVAGAGLASSLAVAVGVVALWVYFQKPKTTLPSAPNNGVRNSGSGSVSSG
jgi:Na+-driven multidrug efflux pump